MNIVRKLTLRHMKENKRRTFVTIIGVIISVAMLTAVSTLAASFIEGMKRQTIAEQGEWHVLYRDVNKDQIEAIEQDKTTKDVLLSQDLGFSMLEGSENEQKPYVFIKAYNEKGFSNFPIELIDGRFPKSEDEIVISETIMKDANVQLKIDDKLKLGIGDRIPLDDDYGTEPLDQSVSLAYSYDTNELVEELEVHSNQAFTIVGIMERPNWEPVWSPGFTVLTYLDESVLEAGHTVNASVSWKKVNKAQKNYAAELANELKLTAFSSEDFNHTLLRYYGVFSDDLRKTLFTFSAIIMAIIIIGSVSLIYNAFAISVSERSRHLGMLSSVGATKKQKRNSVYFEGFIIGIISIPIGVISGITGIGITLMFINEILEKAMLGITGSLPLIVTPLSVIVACLVSILTIFMSTYIPARRASKITAIDAIRQAEDIKLTGKKVKTNRLVRKLFGMEAEIGLKNLKRNKRRYVATILSLVISIILFLSVTYFTDSLKQVNNMTTDHLNFDIVIHQGGQTDEQWNRLVEKTIALDTVTDYSKSNIFNVYTWLGKSEIPSEMQEITYTNEQDEHQLYVEIITLNDEKLKEFADEVGVDFQELQSQDILNGIAINKTSFGIDNKYYELQPLKKPAGESIKLFGDNDEEEFYIDSINIMTDTEALPVGVVLDNGLKVIVSEQTLKEVTSNIASGDNDQFFDFYESNLYLKSSDPIKTGKEIDDIREVAIAATNFHEVKQQDEQLILLLSVFTYGFITLITLISVANIFNTISTSIALRKREFAMLKSMGMTPKGFNRMINYESVFYGMKALLYGLPISIGLMYLMHRTLGSSFHSTFTLPWGSLLFVTFAIFLIVGSAMLYASSKVKKENIIDSLKQESI